MLGFLQGFDGDAILAENPVENIARPGYIQGLHLAMLDQMDIAHEIFSVLAAHKLYPRKRSPEALGVKMAYLDAPFEPPFELDDEDPEAMQRRMLVLRQWRPNIGGAGGGYYHTETLENVTAEWYEELQGRAVRQMTGDTDGANAAAGNPPMDLAMGLCMLVYMADKLGRDADVHNYLSAIAKRIHVPLQAEHVPLARVAWEKLFRNGRLLELLEVDAPAIRDYGQFVLRTLKSRLENGLVRPDDVYKGKSIRELLDELEHNTMNDSEFDPIEWGYDDPDHPEPTTIFKEPATDEAIAAVEERIGRPLPDEHKEFLKITNGCEQVKTYPGGRGARLVPAEELTLEDDANLWGYGVSFLPDFDLVERTHPISPEQQQRWKDLNFKVEDIADGGHAMAMYENDGQGTHYIWLLPPGVVDVCRARVQEVYDMVDEADKKRIEEAIVLRYGSRKAYDDMEYCICTQEWGQPEGCKVYVSFMSFLRAVVYDSRPSTEVSPLKVDEGI